MNAATALAVHDIVLLLLAVAAAASGGVLGALLARSSDAGAFRSLRGMPLAAVVLGTGIWITSLLGLHAFGLTVAAGWPGASAWLAFPVIVAAAFIALSLTKRAATEKFPLLLAALVLGVGIVVVQLLVVRAAGVDLGLALNPWPLLLSLLFAVGGSVTCMHLMAPRPAAVDWPWAAARYGGIALTMAVATSGAQTAGMSLSRIPAELLHGMSAPAYGWLLPALAVGALLLLFATATLVAQVLLRCLHRARLRSSTMQESRTRIRALYDPATMMRNRASLQLELANLIYRCEAAGKRFDVLQGTLHLPGLHEDGEIGRAMAVIATRLRPLLRASDLLARSGPTEFVLLRPRDNDGDVPGVLLERLLTACQLPLSVDRLTISPQARIGCSAFPDDGLNSRQLLLAAMPAGQRVVREASIAAAVGAPGEVAV